MDATIELNQ